MFRTTPVLGREGVSWGFDMQAREKENREVGRYEGKKEGMREGGERGRGERMGVFRGGRG